MAPSTNPWLEKVRAHERSIGFGETVAQRPPPEISVGLGLRMDEGRIGMQDEPRRGDDTGSVGEAVGTVDIGRMEDGALAIYTVPYTRRVTIPAP